MARTQSSFVLCIDVEPRGRQDVYGGAEEWAGFFTCIDYLNDWRRRYHDQTGRKANFCWLLRLDDQVLAVHGSRDWFVDRFRDEIRELIDAGDAIGLHHHTFGLTEAGWREDFTDPTQPHKIAQDRDAFVAALGFQPECGSYGAGWLTQDGVAALEAAGFKYDMTLTPARPARPADVPAIGSYPDYTHAPREPYRPSRGDFLRPGRGSDALDLWLLPVSTSCGMHPGEWHPGYDTTHRMDQLNLSLPAAFVQPHIEAKLAASEPVTLCLLRTGDISMPSFDTALRQNGEYLLGHPALETLAFETPAAAIARYTSRLKPKRALRIASTV